MMNEETLAMINYVETLFTDVSLIPEWKKLLDHSLITAHCGTLLACLSAETQRRVYLLSENRRMTERIAEMLKCSADRNDDLSNAEIIKILIRTPTIDEEVIALKKKLFTDKGSSLIRNGRLAKELSLYSLITEGKL